MLSSNNQGFVFQSLFESLEDRVLFDGVPDATFVLPQADVDQPVPAQVQNVQQADLDGQLELILVDAGVENSEELLAGILESNQDTTFEIRILNNDQDGVSQITQLLAESEGKYSAVHFISHGDEGEVHLGNSTLSSENLNRYADQLAGWSEALTDDADLLFYGCNLAGNEAGESFVASIAALTGADVAASDDVTGAAELDGNWDLEFVSGRIESASLAAYQWQGSLALSDAKLNIVSDGTPTWDGDNLAGNDTDGANGIIRSHDTISMEVFYNTDSGGATDLNFTSTLPDGLVWDVLPAAAALDSRSMIVDSVTGLPGGDMRTMIAYLPDVSGTFTSSIPFEARALGGEQGTPLTGIEFEVNATENASSVETESFDFTLSSAANMDIQLFAPTFRGAFDDPGGNPGVVYSYPIGILGAHPTRSGSDGVKGSAPIEDNFTFDVDLTNVATGAQIFDWGASLGANAEFGLDGISRNYERFTNAAGSGATGWSNSSKPSGQTTEHPTSTAWSQERSTPDSGDWTITGSAGEVFSAQVSGANTFGPYFPDRTAGNSVLPAGQNWFTSSIVHVWIPLDQILLGEDGIDGTTDDGVLTVVPELTNFDPNDAYGVTNNFGAGTEDTSNNDYSHEVVSFRLGGPTKYNSEAGHPTSGRWVDTSSAWAAGDGETSVGHQYDARVSSGQNLGVLGLSGIIYGDKFDNTAVKLVPNSLPSQSGDGWSRVYASGGPNTGTHLTYGTDYIIEFGTGGVGGAAGGWTDWNSMGDATLADSETSTFWLEDPTDPALGGTADPDTGVRDSITKWRIKVLRDLEPGESLISLVTFETVGPSTIDPVNNPNQDIIANFVASTGDLYDGLANPWYTSEYDPLINKWYPEGSSGHILRGDRLILVEANVDVDKTVVDLGAGSSYLAGSAARIQLEGTVTIPGPDSGNPAQDVYVTDMLPAGLTVVGGTATPAAGTTYVTGDGTTQSVQSLEYFDGTSWSTTWTYGATGIRWYFGDVPLNTALPTMSFDVLIPFDAENGESWTNTAVISSPSDTSPEDLRNSSAGLVAVQVAAMSAGKFVVTPLVPEDTTIIYELGIANVSDDKDVPWFDLVDILPYDADFEGSSINGNYTFVNVTGLDPDLEIYVTSAAPSIIDGQDGTVDGYADPGTAAAGDAWFIAEGTGIWTFTLDDVANGVAGAPTMDQITAIRVVSDKSVTPFLGPGESTKFQLELTPDGNVGIPSDHYTNKFAARTDPGALPLPVTSAAVTAVVVAPDIEIQKEVALDEAHINIDPTDDTHWGETVNFDDTDKAYFRLKVTNTGTADFLGATVTDNLPAGATFVAGTAAANAGDFSGFPTTWTFDLAAGDTAYLIYQIDVNDSGNYPNTADVTATDAWGETVVDDDDAEANFVTEISAAKMQTGAVRNIANPSLFEVTYEVEVMNTSIFDLANLTLSENLFGAFGPGFMGIMTPPAITSSSLSGTSTLPTINGSFNGNSDDQILNGDGFLEPGDSVTVTYTVFVDPLLLAAPANTVNQVEAGGVTGGPGGTPTTDLSDDGSDPDSDNPGERGDDGMGGTDDPTPLALPAIDLTKEIVGSPTPSVSGVNGNFDVTYEFMVTNTGTTDLDNIALMEDFFANLGDAFVGIVNGPLVTMTTATDNPDFNTGYNGNADSDVFQNTPNTDTFTYGGNTTNTTTRQLYVGDQSIVIDPNQVYDLSVDAFAGDGAGGSFDAAARHYMGFISYDIDGNTVNPYSYAKFAGSTDTTLAAPLNPGDTTITLTDASGWSNGGGVHTRTIAWYGYTDSTGYTYPDYDYTRNYAATAWDAGGISGNTITLNAPWAGPALAAGDAVRNSTSGGSYQYVLLSAGAVPQTTTNYSTAIGGGYISDGSLGTTLFRPGTHSISSLVLADWLNGGTGTPLNIDNFQLEAPNTNLMEPGQKVTFQITVEIDPDAPGAIYDGITGDGNNTLENQASVTAEDPWNNIPVADTSDDPTDSTNAEYGDDSDPDDPTSLVLPSVELTKELVGIPTAAVSGTFGNFDATYEFTITNNGNDDLQMLSLLEDFQTQFGNAFVQIVSQGGVPAVVTAETATDDVEINSGYNGGTDTELFDNTGGNTNLLEMGQTITLQVIVEVDPDAVGAVFTNGQLLNIATVAGTGVESGVLVDDESDDTADTTDSDPDGDNSPDDPTPLIVPSVSIAKSIVGDPVQLDNGNFVVQYQFVVRNMGTTFLSNLQVMEDFAAEFGANVFIQAIAAPVISVDPTDPLSTAPTRSLTYDGSADSNLLDGVSGLLAPADSFTIGVVVELDPNGAGAILPFENTAVVEGDAAEPDGTLITDSGGNPITVTDDSDSGTDPASDNSGAPGDDGMGGTNDPTPLYIADLDITKAIVGQPTLLGNGNHKINYSVVVENTGTVDLANLSLLEDLQTQFGAGFVNVSGLAIGTGPGGASSITLATGTWDGTTANSEMIDNSGGTLLEIGDSFTIEFCVEVNASALPASTTPMVFNNEAAFAAVTGATLQEDFSDVVGNAAVTLPFVSTLGGVEITGSVVSLLGTAIELREDGNSFSGGGPDDGVFAIRQTAGGGTANLRITVPNPGNAIGFVWSDVFDPAGGAPAGEWTYFKATASDGTVLFEHDERTDGDLPGNLPRFVGIQGTGSQVYTHIDIEYETSGNDNWTIDHIYDSGNANDILTNQIVGNADAVDSNGDPIEDSNGDPVTVTDESDSGTTPDDPNSGEPGDTGGSNDPTPLYIPSIGLAKSAGDAVANGDNFDVTFTFVVENTGNVDLNNLTLLDDIQTEFGNAFVSASNLTVQNFVGSGTAPGANSGWETDSTEDMLDGTGQLNVDDTFEVVFTVTIDPDGIDSVSQGLENQGTVGGDALDENGAPLLDGGVPIQVTDDSDNGTDADGENGEDDGDGVYGNDPTPVIIADIGLTKEVFNIAPQGDNFLVTYRLVIENIGTVNLASLTLMDDMASQFGGAFVSAGNMQLISVSSINSSVTVDSAFDGDASPEMIDQTVPTNLVVGDFYVVQFDVLVDPDASGTSGPLDNQATATGDAVDSNGDPINDSNGDPIVTTDDSDSGTEPSDTNSAADGDMGTTDDPTPLLLPALGVAKQANSVTVATDGLGNELNGSFDVQYLVVIENTGTIELTNLQLFDDLTTLAHFGDAYDATVLTGPTDRSGLVTGPAFVSNTMANPGDLPNLNRAFLGGGVQTGLFDGTSGTLQVGEQIVVSFTVRIDGLELLDMEPATDGVGGNQITGTAVSAEGSVTDDSDNGLNPNTDNGNGGTDDFTPFEVPQIRLWKSHSDAIPNADGTSTITVELRIQNSGTVDLSNLTLFENLEAQFGAAYVSTTAASIAAGPSLPGSIIPASLLSAGWSGDTSLDVFDSAETTEMLAAGDEFTISFDVIVDPDLLDDDSEYLENNATVTGEGQNFDGTTIEVTDDSGVDNGTGIDVDEPTSAVVPEIAVVKAASDAVANGDNWDVSFTLVVENTGSVDLDMLTLFDNITTELGNAYGGVTGLAVRNFVGSGTAPTANAAWMGDTALNMLSGGYLDPGDNFEVIFTVTLDPDGIDSTSEGLENQATTGGRGVDQMGNPLTDSLGNELFADDDSDSGTNPQGTNTDGEGDTGLDSDPTPIIIADVSIAKEVFGTPTLLSNGNFAVVYQLVIENIGTVNLSNVSVVDDLMTQFGASVFQGVSGLTMIAGPGDAASSITLDPTNWDGTAATDMVDQLATAPNILAVGDLFTVQFTVEVDAAAATGILDNQATVGGTAVDSSGTPYTDVNGDDITTADDSDSGTTTGEDNSGAPGADGMGGSDDPTPLYIPSIGLAKAAGDAVANGDNWDVEFTLVWENTGTVDLTNLTMLDNIAAQFGNAFVSISGLTVQNFVGGGTAPTANSAWMTDTTLTMITGGTANVDDTFEVAFTVTIDPDGIDDVSQGLQNQATTAGEALDENGDPLTNPDSSPVTAEDTSDNGTNATDENGSEDTTDDIFGNDPTPIVIADISVVKATSGAAVALVNGNFDVTYELVIENIGTVDLANLSLVENMQLHFGSVFQGASNLTLGLVGANSTIVLDSANWNGDTVTEMIDQVATTLLAVGESFVVTFTVEVDPDAVAAPPVLENQVVVTGDAVDANGNDITDSSGTVITTSDDSDDGTDPNSDNPDAQGDDGTGDTDNPTPLLIPDVGLAKVASDAVANGENWDVTFTIVYTNTGTVALDNPVLIDDIAAQFGNAFVSASNITIANFTGAGTAPVPNGMWKTDTTQDMLVFGFLEVGDSFEVSFTITIDPDGIDDLSQALNNQAIAIADAVNPDGTPMRDENGDRITANDVSDDGTDVHGENGSDDGDGIVGNDPTPIIIADISVVKEAVGSPVQLSNGNFDVVYQLVIENTGTVDLANLSLLEDLATQYGAVYVNAHSLTLMSGPSDPNSLVVIDPSWNGGGNTEMIDQVAATLLAVGDSYVIQFTVEVNPIAATGPLTNQVTTGGNAVDENGIRYTDENGDDITATDDSDSGNDPNGDNLDAPGDDGTGNTDNPTPLYVPNIGLAKSAGDAVANGENWDVEFTLVWENTGTVDLTNLTMFDDIAAQFGNAFVSISGLTVQNFVGTGTAPAANATWMGDTTQSMITGGTGDIDDTFEVVFTVTIDPDGIDAASQGLDNQATTSGEALDENGDPLFDTNGDPVTADDTSDDGVDPTSENGEDDGDGTFGNDPTPIIIADISVVKEVFGTPVALSDGTFEVTYQLVVENTGTVDLANLTLSDDVSTQFGAPFVSAGGLTLITPPADVNSNVVVDATWDGAGMAEMIDQAAATSLAVGDSYVVQFTVIVDLDAGGTSGPLDNQVVTGGSAVDENGDPILDSNGDEITAEDDSDTGSDPNDNNPDEQGDTEGYNDPTPLLIPDVALAKAAGDAVANGDNWDVTFTLVFENTGSTTLDGLTLVDDIMSEIGNAFVSANGLTIQNLAGTGTLPTANGAWAGDTTANMLVGGSLDAGGSFEVVFTVTIDPDGIDSVSQGLDNQAVATGNGVNPDGTPMTDSSGNPVTVDDDSDNGVDPNGENGSEDTVDGVTSNDPTPILIADLAIAKAIVGEPVLLFNGNYVVTYQLVVENTGTLDLANLSLLEDLATQFDSAYVNAGNLTLTSGPTDPASSVSVDAAGWNGSSAIEMMDVSASNTLAVGDSFTIEFAVEIDPVAADGTLENQVSGTGDAVDENGAPITDSNGNPIVADDLSDSGTDPGSTNPEDESDTGTSDDPVVLDAPLPPLAEISGTVFFDGDDDGIQDPGDSGIAGVEVTLVGTDVFGNSVEITELTDEDGRYSFTDLNAGEYTLLEAQPDGFDDGSDNGDSAWTIGDDEMSGITLNWGDSFGTSTFAEIAATASGNPPRLPALAPIFNSPISSLLSSYLGGPGPIYSGTPINSNANPLSLDSGRPVLGGYSSDGSSDCGCPEPINPCCEPVDPCGQTLNWTEQPMVDEIVEGDCGCEGEELISGEQAVATETISENCEVLIAEGCEAEALNPCEELDPCANDRVLNQPSFLKRFGNWLSR